MTLSRPANVTRVAAGLACLALAIGGWLVFRDDSTSESRPRAPSPQRTRPKSAQLPPLSPEILRPSRVRAIQDYGGRENTAPSQRALSANVSVTDRAAIESAWQAHNFARAAALTSALTKSEDRRLVFLSLLADWAAAEPANAADFARSLASGAERREMLEVAISTWADRDIVSASKWLSALEPHPDQDGAVAAVALCPRLHESRPDLALNWAETISARTLRWETICTVATDWAHRDPEAARRYVERCTTLTADERARMLAHVGAMTAAVD